MSRLRKAALALAMVVAVVLGAPLASAFAAGEGSGAGTNSDGSGVTIDKTATDLNGDTTTVTLKVGATQKKDKVAVMFLLDKSTSQGMRDEAVDMLNELKTKTNTELYYNVVVFSGTATSTGWKNIADDEGLEDTLTNFANRETTTGTNMDSGITEALSQMNNVPEGVDSTYLVTLSDGISYFWFENGDVMTVPVLQQSTVENPNPGEQSVHDAASAWEAFYTISVNPLMTKSFADIYGSFNEFLNEVPEKIKATKDAGYAKEFGSGYSIESDDLLISPIYENEKRNEIANTYAIAPEISAFECIQGYEKLVAEFDKSFTFAAPEAVSEGVDNSVNWRNYPWGKELMEYLNSMSTNAGKSEISNADPENVFSGIRDVILYEIQSGTVTDVIGKDFDLASLGSFKLKVGESALSGTVDEEAQTVTFGDGNKYVVTYHEQGVDSDQREQFSWVINAPVEQGKGLELSYELKLVNRKTEPGDYTVPTNEKALLDYATTMGENGTAEFPVPEVKYKVTEPGEIVGNDGVTVDKVASPTDLTDTDETTVTLSIGSTEETTAADVVFVLDKSTSDNVKSQALALLDELIDHMKKSNLKINVGVVTFNRVASNEGFNLGLTELNEESYKSISSIFSKKLESGSNLEAGIRAGMAMLDSDDTVVDAENKHLVLVSDGITYMWGTGENPMTMYVELNNTKAASVDLVNDYYTYRSHDWDAYQNAAKWLKDAKTEGIEKEIEAYQTVFTVNSGNDVVPYVPSGEGHPYTSLEGALYKAGKAWADAADSGYQLYAFASTERANKYPWGSKFVGGLGTIGGVSTTYSDTEAGVDGIFNGVKNSIIYELEKGTVTDVIGEDFDLVSLDSFSLKVGSSEYAGDIDRDANTVSFDNSNYVVTYYPNAGGDDVEYFTLDINKPVLSDAGISISYDLKLVDRANVPGEYKNIPTNESAVLEYESSDGEENAKLFPVPEVNYTVNEQAVTVRPADITVYMGGDEGYEGVIDGNDKISGSNSLPEPGFYFELPGYVNDALEKAGITSEGETADLSQYMRIYTEGYEGESGELHWKIEKYGNSYSGAYDRHIYRIVPVPTGGQTPVPVRLQFTSEDGSQTFTSDTFDPSMSEALYEKYTMKLFTELVENDTVVFEIDVPTANGESSVPYCCPMELKTGTLTIRYVTGEQEDVVTDVLAEGDLAAARAADPDKAFAVLPEDTTYTINSSDVDVSLDGDYAAAPSLLFDDVVSDHNTDEAEAYDEQLADLALRELDDNGVKLENPQYQAKYLDLVDANNGNVWLSSSNPVDVYWPYPNHTDQNTTFYLVHFEDLDREMTNESIVEEINGSERRVVEVDTDEHGIKFTTESFSPFVLVWGASSTTPPPPSGDDKGDLTIKKEITGDLKSADDVFTFQVTVKGAGDQKFGNVQFTDGVATIQLKGGESITISDLPEGADYAIVETDAGGYELVSATNDDGEITDDEVTATFTNDKSTPDEPEDPDEPDNPDDPDEPDNPDEPDEPDNPDEPDEPDNPGTPDTPDDPGDPGTPSEPSKPGRPSTPTSQVPDAGDHTSAVLPVALVVCGVALVGGGLVIAKRRAS